jgi:hypothetical protein
VAGTSTTGYRLNRQDRPTAAAEEFQASTTRAGQQLEQTSGDYQALDTKALALCGHALTTEPGKAAEACTVFRAARAKTSADGISCHLPDSGLHSGLWGHFMGSGHQL